jgi:hypothetical protein
MTRPFALDPLAILIGIAGGAVLTAVTAVLLTRRSGK